MPLGEPRWDDDAFGDKMEVVAAERVAMVSFTFGCPSSEEVDSLHTAGCTVAVTVTSAAEARVADAAGADLVAVQGTEAGGHQGRFLDHQPNRVPLATLLDEVAGSTALPRVGTGGIMTGGHVADALRAGAVGVQLGTAFLGCDEAGTSATYRRRPVGRRLPRDDAHPGLQRSLGARSGQRVRGDLLGGRPGRLPGGPPSHPPATGGGDRGR